MTRRFNISHILFNLSKAMSVFFLVSMMLGYVLLPSQIDTPTVFQPVSVNAATAPRYGYNCNAGITSNGGCLNSLGTGAEASGCILTSTNKTLCANVPESLKNSTNTFYIIDGCDEVICTSGSETFSNCRNGECTVKQTAAQAATGVNTVPVQSYIPGEPKVTRITCQAGIDTASSSTSPRVTVSNCINDSTGELVSRGKPDYCAAWTKNNATQVVLNCRPQAIGFIGSHECLNDRNAAILIVCTPSELIAGDTGEYISVWDEPLDGCYYFLNKLGDAICVTDKDINEVCQTREVNIQTNNTGTNYLIRIAGDIIAERNTARACAKTQAEFINELSNRGYNVVSGIEGFSAELNVATAFDVAACELESLAVGESKECQGQRITKTDDPACLYKTDDGTCYGADGARVQVGDDTSNGDFGLPGVDDLFEALHQIVSIVILLLLIFLGWIAQGLFWIVSLVALTLLQINPAGATFFQVALGPWGIMVSIASIILLSGFVFVGFKYILGSGKSVKVDQFLTNVVIVGVSILFTLFACAGVINLAQGVGDVFLAGYQAASGTSRQEALFGKLVTGVAKVSYLRCGNLETTDSGTECESGAGELSNGTSPLDAISVGGNLLQILFQTKMGTRTTAMFAEAVFLVTIGYGIYIMWKAMFIALLRVVGLWLLMIVSPIALVGFFSPIPFFKKQAEKWLQKFVELTLFYPIFIIGLVLVGELSGTFGQAAQAEVAKLQSGNSFIFGPYITTFANETGLIEGAVMQVAILFMVAAVSIGSMHLLLNFMTKTFGGMVGAALAWGGKAVGMLASGGRLLTKGAGALGITGAEKLSNALSSGNTKKLSNQIQQLEQRGNSLTATERTTLRNKKSQLKSLKAAQAARKKKFGNAREAVNKFADGIEYLPEQFKDTFSNIKGNLSAQKDARIAGRREYYKRKEEIWARSKGLGWAMNGPNAYYPGMDQNMAANKLADPNLKKELEGFAQRSYNQKLQLRDLPRNENQKNVLDLAESSDGTLDSLGHSQNAFLDGLNNMKNDPAFIAKQAHNSKFATLLGEALATDQVDDELQTLIEEVLPQFIQSDDAKRAATRTALAKPEGIRKIDPSAFLNPVVYQEAKSHLMSTGKTAQEADNEVFRNAGAPSGRSSAAMRAQTKAALASRGIDIDSTDGKNVAGLLDRFHGQASQTGYNSREAVQYLNNNPSATISDLMQHLDAQNANLYGASTIEQLSGLSLANIEGSSEGAKIVDQLKSSGISDPTELLTVSQAAIETIITGSKSSQEIYAGHIYESVKNSKATVSEYKGLTDPLHQSAIKGADDVLKKLQNSTPTSPAAFNADDFKRQAAVDIAHKAIGSQLLSPVIEIGTQRYDMSSIDETHAAKVNDAMKSMTAAMLGGGTGGVAQAQAIANQLTATGIKLPPAFAAFVNDITSTGSALHAYLNTKTQTKANEMLREINAYEGNDARLQALAEKLNKAKETRGKSIAEVAGKNPNSYGDLSHAMNQN